MQSQQSQNWGSVALFYMPRFLEDSKLISFSLGKKNVILVRDEKVNQGLFLAEYLLPLANLSLRSGVQITLGS